VFLIFNINSECLYRYQRYHVESEVEVGGWPDLKFRVSLFFLRLLG